MTKTTLIAAFATTGMEKLLFRVPARDATTFTLTSLLLIGTGVLASWLPAARATRTDPADVLRRDG